MKENSPQADAAIRIRNARTNNLKGVDVDLPRNRLVVITGRSGSGKSSLAFGTLYAEGQRQYLESLSPEARQLFQSVPRAEVDLIEGLQPTLSFDQIPGFAHRRATVGTLSEVNEYLKVLFARLGTVHCPDCGTRLEQHTEDQVVRQVMELPDETKAMILAPLSLPDGPGIALAAVRRERLVRVRVDGQVRDIDDVDSESLSSPVHLDAVTDRVVIRPGVEERLHEAIKLATRLGEGRVTLVFRLPADGGKDPPEWEEWAFSLGQNCVQCGQPFPPVEPRLFSFNSPYGACPQCDGMGWLDEFDPSLIVADPSRSLTELGVTPWADFSRAHYRKSLSQLTPLLERLSISPDTPWCSVPAERRHELLYSDQRESPGLVTLLQKEWATELDESRRIDLERFRRHHLCPSCVGSRLNRHANAVQLAGQTLGDWNRITVDQLLILLDAADWAGQPAGLAEVADRLLAGIRSRLEFLQQTGVGHLSLGRATATLSGGELQRVRLARSLGMRLTGVCYVLDEPTVGLHPIDTQKLLHSLRQLQQEGNTVVVVEHDEAVMRAADYLIDIGPGAGNEGGRLVACGTADDLIACPDSVTGRQLAHRGPKTPLSENDRTAPTRWLTLHGASGHNLQQLTVPFPLDRLVAVTGVSGSGKSTLVNDTLYPILARHLGRVAEEPAPFERIEGIEQIEQLFLVDQRPIGRSPRGCAATYSGIMAPLRKIFAATPLAKQRGYAASRFSFNDGGGACGECRGRGRRKLKMNFLRDLEIECEACHGRRYDPATLQVRFRGHSIADFLEMPIEQAHRELSNIEEIRRILASLIDVGLGHLSLGQPATTLSGGEAQRIKLATELARRDPGHTLYLLDEPTTGLHSVDIAGLTAVLRGLVEQSNTVIVIEHNPELIVATDWVIDLGPGGGDRGGRLVAAGPPDQIATHPDSVTGRFLGPKTS